MPIKKTNVKPAKKVATSRAVEKEKMVSFGCAVANFFKKYFQFSGTATRAEFWWTALFLLLCGLGLILVISLFVFGATNVYERMFVGYVMMMSLGVFGLITIIPWYALMARRLHDAGFTAWLLLISIAFSVYGGLAPWGHVPDLRIIRILDTVWFVFLLILFVLPSRKKDNPYRK